MPDFSGPTVFVAICAYRDPELRSTIEDCISKANHPDRLHFGICNQFDAHTFISESDFPNARIASVHYSKALGLGWARQHVQNMFSSQKYILQLDSHMRFKAGWDVYLTDLHRNALDDGIELPLITAACPEWQLDTETYLINTGTKITFKKFFQRGTIEYQPRWFSEEEQQKKYVSGVFVSGHFYFVSDTFFSDFKFDPQIYFGGEETCLSVRSFTLGYDVIHPADSSIYHAYSRSSRNLHWLDHATPTATNNSNIDVEKMELKSTRRIRQLLDIEDTGINLGDYGLGQRRSLDQWITLSGVDIRNSRLLE